MSDLLALGSIGAVTVGTVVVGARGVRTSRTPADFLVAARQVRPRLNAAAISGEYLSAASFLGLAGLALSDGVGALWYGVGYATGYLILLVTVAAPLRRFGAYTIPDFAEGRLQSRTVRRTATVLLAVICTFYLLPQLQAAGLTLHSLVGLPAWVGVVSLGVVVTANIAAGGMKGITLVQAVQYWLKLVAIALPAVILVVLVRGAPLSSLTSDNLATFPHATSVRFVAAENLRVVTAVNVAGEGTVGGHLVHGDLRLAPGYHEIASGTVLRFPAGSTVPTVSNLAPLTNAEWSSPFIRLGGKPIHPLAATYGVILATFLGTLGLPHILVRFYTNPDGRGARRTAALVLLLLGCFYVFPAVFATLGRLDAPGLYVSGNTDSLVLVLPKLAEAGITGRLLAALTAAGAFAAFLSTSSGLLITLGGAIAHDIFSGTVHAFRSACLAAGCAVTVIALVVRSFPISVLVGWAFTIAASSFCPLLLLGIWWPRLTRTGAMAGLALGGAASTGAIVATIAGAGETGWPALLLQEPAIWTVPVAFLTMVTVSLFSRRSMPPEVDRMMRALHLPEPLRHGGRDGRPDARPSARERLGSA
ncbi:MAG: cation acetate symporter [Acidimicrobiales bacterium]|jgi:Na+(H+)/acetate symporter ActP